MERKVEKNFKFIRFSITVGWVKSSFYVNNGFLPLQQKQSDSGGH
jgi:hypothetical protein